MGDPAGPLLSVRADARQTVAPDYAVLAGAFSVPADGRPDAVRAAARDLDHLTSDLAGLGGVPLNPQSGRDPLTWSAQSVTTHAEREHDEQTGHYELTGRVTATVAVIMTIRAFELLDALSTVLAAHATLSVHDVSWGADWDNPAWRAVRAAAIRAAIGKGRDYAAALGGSLDRVEHIADAGLLGASDSASFQFSSTSRGALRSGGDDRDVPSLDPVPQELTAVIEARFTAAGVTLAEPGPATAG